MRNIFLEKSYTKCGRDASLRPFHKKSKLSVSLDQQPEMLLSLVLLYVLAEIRKNILKLSCSSLAFILYIKLVKKNKKMSGTSLATSFSA